VVRCMMEILRGFEVGRTLYAGREIWQDRVHGFPLRGFLGNSPLIHIPT
jgi:hypothetical protein